MAKNPNQAELNSIPTTSLISKELKVVGEMHCKENIRIEGEFSGTLIVDGFLRIGRHGKLNAEVKVNTVAIEGELVGNVIAKEKVHLYPTGQLRGDVRCPRTGLSIDPGALFEGRSIMHDEIDDIIKKKTKGMNPNQTPNNKKSNNN